MDSGLCCACTRRDLRPFLDLGCAPLSHRLRTADHHGEPEPRFAHALAVCPGCGLVQNATPLPGPWASREATLPGPDMPLTRALAVAGNLLDQHTVYRGDLVVEIGSRDGTLLAAFQKYGLRAVGIEPGRQPTRSANALGVETLCAALGPMTGGKVRARYGPARLVLARETLALTSDPRAFVRGLALLLADGGRVVLTVPDLLAIHDDLRYDRFAHRFRGYFSAALLAGLLAGAGLEVVDVQRRRHAGLLLTAQRLGDPRWPSVSVQQHLRREWEAGLHRVETWAAFGQRVAWSRGLLRAELDRLRAAGKTVAGYGVTVDGMGLLTACRLGPDRVKYVIDADGRGAGQWTPGYPIPIVGPAGLPAKPPDVVLVLDPALAADNNKILATGAETPRLIPLPAPHYVARSGDAGALPLRRAG